MMYSIDKLTLISGIDIPIPELQVNIHQPTIREIAYIGEKEFYTSANILTMTVEKFLRVNSNNLAEEGKFALSSMSNFELIMMMIGQEPLLRTQLLTLLTLLFPNHMIEMEADIIILIDPKKPTNLVRLDNNNFSILQEIVGTVLCLQSGIQKEEFNPSGDLAKAIAEKLMKGREKVSQLKGDADKQTSFLSRYISSLGIGTSALNLSNILDLTLYQLFDQMERFGLRESYNIAIKAKMAGAKDVDDVDWLKDIEK